MLNSIRVKYVRGEETKYISHLDMMKAFERAIRRSGLPISYSQGFNPHPQMVFGLPLSVGVTSEAEYADFILEEKIEPEHFMDKLNLKFPQGLKVVAAKTKSSKGNIMAEVSRASYDVIVSSNELINISEICKNISALLDKHELIISKRSKGKTKDVDIRDMIFGVEAHSIEDYKTYKDRGNIFQLKLLLSAGSKANLKPELLIEALNRESGINFIPLKIHRTGLFVGVDGQASDPLEVC